MGKGFSVIWRNSGHWDVVNSERRLFRIRGEEGDVILFDERENRTLHEPSFKTVSAAMAWINDQLMHEPKEETNG